MTSMFIEHLLGSHVIKLHKHSLFTMSEKTEVLTGQVLFKDAQPVPGARGQCLPLPHTASSRSSRLAQPQEDSGEWLEFH